MAELLKHWEFAAFLASWLVGSIAAAVSLKHQVENNKESIHRAFVEIEKIQTKVELMDSETVKELGRVREALARIEGMLKPAVERST